MTCDAESIATPSCNSTASLAAKPSRVAYLGGRLHAKTERETSGGCLIINGDDWGRDLQTTDRTLECFRHGSVSSVSAMVFMEDSERAAAIARERGIDTGLHLNFTTPFLSKNCPSMLREHQQKVSRRMLRHRLAQAVFYPALTKSFEYVVSAQLDEYRRLYGERPQRLDGHHHMHLCANVLLGGLLPQETIVRRNFSFQAGEKSLVNRFYRMLVDYILARHHRLADFFFSLAPLEDRTHVQRIFTLGRSFVVEVEAHPVNPEEYRFLRADEIVRTFGRPIAPGYVAGLKGSA